MFCSTADAGVPNLRLCGEAAPSKLTCGDVAPPAAAAIASGEAEGDASVAGAGAGDNDKPSVWDELRAVLASAVYVRIVLGYAALWTNPAQGAFMLSVIMAGAIHFHMTFLKDPVGRLTIQFALLFASLAIMFLSRPTKTTKPKTTRRTSSRKTKRS